MQMLADKRAFCLSPKGNSTTSDWRRKCSPPFMSVAVGIMGISGNALQQTAIIMQIHIGHLIRDEVRRQGRTNQWLADQMSIDRSTLQRLFNKPSIDTQQLFRISKILGRDFFRHYSDMLSV